MSQIETRAPGSCRHRPTSNGWSGGWNHLRGELPRFSWCGYCKAYIEHDAEWAAKFAALESRRSA